MRLPYRLLWTLLLWGVASGALAESCTISTSNLASGTNYNPFATAPNDTGGAFTITCTRAKGDRKFPNNFYVGVSNGLSFDGSTRRLASGGNYLAYGLYMNFPGCSTPWGQSSFADVYTLQNGNTQGSQTTTSPDPLGTRAFCFRIAPGMSSAPFGTYTDTVQVRVGTGPTDIWGTAAVTLTTTIGPACFVTTPPGNITLNYTSFSATPVSGSSSWQLRCTSGTTYNLGFDTPSGTVLGLNYVLSHSAASGVGTGLAQGYTLTATIPAGQAGTCAGAACTTTVTRSVLVTY